MFCSKCGKEITDDQKFCLNCGKKIEKNSKEEPNAQTTAQATSLVVETQEKPETAQSTTEKFSAPVGFILGLVSIIACILPLVGYPATICGIIFSANQLKSPNKTSRVLAITGLVLSIIFLIFTLFNSLIGVLMYFVSIID